MEPEDLRVRVRVRQWVWDGVVEGTQCIDHLRGAGDEVWQQSHPSLHDSTVEESLAHGGQDT
jgi:hypothetical protein